MKSQIRILKAFALSSLTLIATAFGANAQAAQINRYFSNTYGHSASIYQQGVGWTYDGFLGTSNDAPAPGLVRVNECFVVGATLGAFFYSTSSNCEGQRPTDANLGYVSNSYGQYGMTRAIYRCFNPSNGDRLLTNSDFECWNAGYTVESVIGWVW